MTGPEDETAASAGGRGRLRASHADREQVIGVLKAAFVQGRLTKDELDARAGQTFTARTYGELAAVTADLPAGLVHSVPPRHATRAQARPPMSNAAKAGRCVAIAVAVAVIVSVLTGGAAFQMFARLYVMALLAAGAQMLVNWHDSRSRRGQLPPRPTRRGLALEGEQDRRPGDDLTLCQARSGVCAHHVPGHTVSRRAWRSLATGRDARRPANLQVTA